MSVVTFDPSPPRKTPGRNAHFFDSAVGQHVLLVDGSRIYDLDQAFAETLRARIASGAEPNDVLGEAGLGELGFGADLVPEPPPVKAISLAVAQSCNLACDYCYAGGGTFGGRAKNMPEEVARRSIDTLIGNAEPGDRVNIGYLGGEPLINRQLIIDATRHAKLQARRRGVQVGFSITTNGTLLTPADGEFFEQHGFSVSISLDGLADDHNRARRTKSGQETYGAIIARVQPLLAMQRDMQVSARISISSQQQDLPGMLDAFLGMGFHSVGFAPVLRASSGAELAGSDIPAMLESLKICGRRFVRKIIAGERYAFSNIESALQEIHKGTHRPYPCGAGAAYLGVSAEGGLYACHRFVADEEGEMGDVLHGPDEKRRQAWLIARHVDAQTPCQQCWARYLCGGGCHHEVMERGRPACDYIRGWLDFCLGAYVELMTACPQYFVADTGVRELP